MTQQNAPYPLDYSKPVSRQGPSNPATPEKDWLEKTRDTAEEQLKTAAQGAQDMAETVAEQARVYGEKAQEAARNFKPYVEKSMKDQPMPTLAVAAVIGFALGALWKK